MSVPIEPVLPAERIAAIDILRGFALFGVLLVNIVVFTGTIWDTMAGVTPLLQPALLPTVAEQATIWAVVGLAMGKFCAIFSFLFGLGFFMFIQKSYVRGGNSSALYHRRLLILFLFGLANLTFVWHGDILHVYAIIGLFLLSFQHASLSRLKFWAICLLSISTLIFLANAVVSGFTDTEVGSTALANLRTLARDTYRHGSYLDVIVFRLQHEVGIIMANVIFLIPKGLGLFLMGVYTGRLGILENIRVHKPLIRRAWYFGGAIGVLCTFLHVALQLKLVHFNLSSHVTAGLLPVLRETGTIFLAVFYMSSIVLALNVPIIARVLSPLAALGRMPLTNYLAQCIICSLLFYGYGAGWMSGFNMLYVPVLAVTIYGTQLYLSAWWMKSHAHGPLEWVWRRMTYGTMVPLNRNISSLTKMG